MERTYLGDSVYCVYDGYHIILSLNNGEEDHDIIYMEPSVINSFINYLNDCKTFGILDLRE